MLICSVFLFSSTKTFKKPWMEKINREEKNGADYEEKVLYDFPENG